MLVLYASTGEQSSIPQVVEVGSRLAPGQRPCVLMVAIPEYCTHEQSAHPPFDEEKHSYGSTVLGKATCRLQLVPAALHMKAAVKSRPNMDIREVSLGGSLIAHQEASM
jgi:hypothetical protein